MFPIIVFSPFRSSALPIRRVVLLHLPVHQQQQQQGNEQTKGRKETRQMNNIHSFINNNRRWKWMVSPSPLPFSLCRHNSSKNTKCRIFPFPSLTSKNVMGQMIGSNSSIHSIIRQTKQIHPIHSAGASPGNKASAETGLHAAVVVEGGVRQKRRLPLMWVDWPRRELSKHTHKQNPHMDKSKHDAIHSQSTLIPSLRLDLVFG